ncbi:hypothetical protein J6590_053563 [Homalodisca vitripennis]|nr:hypothetical protein J6590_053563 [Homalodisca vitripennis]
MKNGSHIKEEETDDKSADIVVKEEAKPLLEEEIKKEFIVKQDIFAETPETGFKTDEPVPKKKRRSRWAANDEKVDMPPTMPLVPPPPPPGLPPGIRPPGVGPVGMVVPSALGVVNTIVPPMNPTVPSVNVPGKYSEIELTYLFVCGLFVKERLGYSRDHQRVQLREEPVWRM